MKIYLFKIKDYSTVCIGRRQEDKNAIYIQLPNGDRRWYTDSEIEWSELIFNSEEEKRKGSFHNA